MILLPNKLEKNQKYCSNFHCFSVLNILNINDFDLKDFYTIIWSGTKEMRHVINDKEILIPKNHFLYLSPCTSHKFGINEDNTDSYLFLFKEEFLAKTIAEKINLQNSTLFSLTPIYAIKNNICDEETFKKVFINHITKDALLYFKQQNYNILERILLNGHLACKDVDDKSIKNNNYDAVLALKFRNLVQTNVLNEKQVSFYADQLFVTKRRLDKATLIVYNKKAKEIIIDEIIKNAKILLLHTDKQIKDISLELNFQQETNFTAFFKKNTGISPSCFRKCADN